MIDSAVDPHSGQGPCVRLLPNPRRFIVRAGVWSFLAVVVLAFVVFRRAHDALIIAVFLAIAAALEWIALKSSSVTLEEEGFAYRTFGKRRAAYRWIDIETFNVVTHRVLGFIKTSEFLGWRFSPHYKHYKKLAIFRALARAVGMSDGMVKMPGYDPGELASLMNECVQRARHKTAQHPQ